MYGPSEVMLLKLLQKLECQTRLSREVESRILLNDITVILEHATAISKCFRFEHPYTFSREQRLNEVRLSPADVQPDSARPQQPCNLCPTWLISIQLGTELPDSSSRQMEGRDILRQHKLSHCSLQSLQDPKGSHTASHPG
jgi:hypothetical protein